MILIPVIIKCLTLCTTPSSIGLRIAQRILVVGTRILIIGIRSTDTIPLTTMHDTLRIGWWSILAHLFPPTVLPVDIPTLGIVTTLHLLKVVTDIRGNIVAIQRKEVGHTNAIRREYLSHHHILDTRRVRKRLIHILEVVVHLKNLAGLGMEHTPYPTCIRPDTIQHGTTSRDNRTTSCHQIIQVFFQILFRQSVTKLCQVIPDSSPVHLT